MSETNVHQDIESRLNYEAGFQIGDAHVLVRQERRANFVDLQLTVSDESASASFVLRMEVAEANELIGALRMATEAAEAESMRTTACWHCGGSGVGCCEFAADPERVAA